VCEFTHVCLRKKEQTHFAHLTSDGLWVGADTSILQGPLLARAGPVISSNTTAFRASASVFC